jgi:phage-related protein
MHRGFAKVDERFQQVDADIQGVRDEIQGLRTEVRGEIAAMDAKFDAKFDSLNRTIIVLLGGSLSVVAGGLLAAVFHVVS